MKGVATFKKAIAMICTVMLLITVFTGCGQQNAGETEATTAVKTAASTDAAEPAAVNPYEKHLKYTFSSVDAGKAGKNENGSIAENYKWLTEKFNFELEFLPLDWSNYIDQTRLWLASGDAPDLMMLDIDITRYPEYLAWVKDGVLKPYPEFGSKYPNLQQKLDKMITGQKFIVDGVLYAWPAYLDLEKYNYVQNNMPLYRKDWAEKVGLAKENDEYTWDEWITLVKTVIEKDPGGNGAGKTIGVYGVDWMFPVYFGPGGLSPNMDRFFQKEDGTWAWGPAQPETVDAIKLAKQLYDEGVIWKDQLIIKNADAETPFISGKAFSFIAGNILAGFADEVGVGGKMAKANPGFKPEDSLRVAFVKTPAGKLLCRQVADQWSQTAMNKNLDDERVERWCSILDYLVTDEGYYFRNLGIPEKDWTMENGQPVVKWPVNDAGQQTYPYTNGSWPWLRAAGCNDGFDLLNPAHPEWARKLAAQAYERLNGPDVEVIKLMPDLDYYSSPLKDGLGQKVKQISDVIKEIMLSKGDVAKEWTDWVNSELPDIQPVLEELNKKLK